MSELTPNKGVGRAGTLRLISGDERFQGVRPSLTPASGAASASPRRPGLLRPSLSGGRSGPELASHPAMGVSAAEHGLVNSRGTSRAAFMNFARGTC